MTCSYAISIVKAMSLSDLYIHKSDPLPNFIVKPEIIPLPSPLSRFNFCVK